MKLRYFIHIHFINIHFCCYLIGLSLTYVYELPVSKFFRQPGRRDLQIWVISESQASQKLWRTHLPVCIYLPYMPWRPGFSDLKVSCLWAELTIPQNTQVFRLKLKLKRPALLSDAQEPIRHKCTWWNHK